MCDVFCLSLRRMICMRHERAESVFQEISPTMTCIENILYVEVELTRHLLSREKKIGCSELYISYFVYFVQIFQKNNFPFPSLIFVSAFSAEISFERFLIRLPVTANFQTNPKKKTVVQSSFKGLRLRRREF